MSSQRIASLKIKAKLLQKAKKRAGKPIALKEALAIIAQHAGFDSWRDMKSALELHERLRPPQASAHWNMWYASYEEAKAHLGEHGGYLLPYQKHYFICDESYLRSLGLDPRDPDVVDAGGNWVEPSDAAAMARVLRKIKTPS